MKKKLLLVVLVLAMVTMPVAAYASNSSGHGDSDDDNRTYVDPAKPATSTVPAATTAETTLKQSTTTNGVTNGTLITASDGSINFKLADGTLFKYGWVAVAGIGGNVWKYFDENGKMVIGKWVWVKGKDGKTRCYYLGADGTCYMNGVTPDGYYVDATGAWYQDNKVQFR